MRRLVPIVMLLLTVLAPRSTAQGLDWDIEDLAVQITVLPDGSLDISETIVADFSREPHRGIYREIPFRYERRGSAFNLRLEVTGVANEAGEPRPFVTERRGDRVWMRVGRADRFLEGRQTYVIRYTVERAILALDTHDELYWNAIGAEWPVPIAQASCVVELPDGVEPASVRAQSFVGPFGVSSTGPEPQISGSTVRFEVPRGLRAGEGLTVVVGWPPGVVEHPSLADRVAWFIRDNIIVVLPFLTGAFWWLVWRTWGRDRAAPGTVVVRYEPPDGLTPIEVGTLADEWAQPRDVTATIVHLAVRGYLDIDATLAPLEDDIKPSRIRLIKRRDPDDQVAPFERTLLDKLFESGESVKLSDLQNKFHTNLADVQKKTYARLTKAGYFVANPSTVRTGWAIMGFLWLGATVLAALILAKFLPPVPVVIAAVLTGPQLLIIAPAMPRKTAKGRRALEGIRGLEEYIARAELQEIESRARQSQFDALLPYALALGLSDAWASKFEGLFTPEPEWYRGPSGLAPVIWASHLDSATSSMGTTLSSVPRSSGSGGSSFGSGGSGFSGGFSGGGGGGGGGGAW